MEEPICRFGYTESQVRKMVGNRYDEFVEWMSGQTMALCGGEVCSEPHGPIVYQCDLEGFLKGRPIYD